MEREGLTRAELARQMGVSRARVTQLLNVLKLPSKKIKRIKAYGDNFGRPYITERLIRKTLKEYPPNRKA
jgi:transcriptional regulator with XRE-family HTH domain